MGRPVRTGKLTAAGKAESITQTRNEKVSLFRALGVTDAMLLNALQVPGIADIGADEIVAMAAWHKQLMSKECTLEDIFGSTEDAEIAQLMEALHWNEAQKTMANTNYKGRRSELLEYVRAQAKAAADATGGKPAVVKPKAKESVAANPTPTSAAAEPSSTAQILRRNS
jgi:hypothetical protein